jgi:hypothetical protein
VTDLSGISRGGAPIAAPVPQAGPTFPAEVEVITVDALVLDGHGRPVTGLTRDDFRVVEDGKPREIVSFEAYERGGTPGGDEKEETFPALGTSPPFRRRRGDRGFHTRRCGLRRRGSWNSGMIPGKRGGAAAQQPERTANGLALALAMIPRKRS